MSILEAVQRDATEWERALARKVRGQLAEHEYSQDDAAAVLGLSQAAVNRRLRGHVSFTAPELAQLAMWLDVQMSQLLPPLTALTERDLNASGPLSREDGPEESACSLRPAVVVDFPTIRIPLRALNAA